ncbi:unnamed protein product [Phytomonas sp. EM1]|nr:unnamed protein product [Phytomonas sp. EM1]|eukprot:CCW59602.1 unnamed protein product [Phytomonas sp. isolate EM1]
MLSSSEDIYTDYLLQITRDVDNDVVRDTLYRMGYSTSSVESMLGQAPPGRKHCGSLTPISIASSTSLRGAPMSLGHQDSTKAFQRLPAEHQQSPLDVQSTPPGATAEASIPDARPDPLEEAPPSSGEHLAALRELRESLKRDGFERSSNETERPTSDLRSAHRTSDLDGLTLPCEQEAVEPGQEGSQGDLRDTSGTAVSSAEDTPGPASLPCYDDPSDRVGSGSEGVSEGSCRWVPPRAWTSPMPMRDRCQRWRLASGFIPTCTLHSSQLRRYGECGKKGIPPTRLAYTTDDFIPGRSINREPVGASKRCRRMPFTNVESVQTTSAATPRVHSVVMRGRISGDPLPRQRTVGLSSPHLFSSLPPYYRSDPVRLSQMYRQQWAQMEKKSTRSTQRVIWETRYELLRCYAR